MRMMFRPDTPDMNLVKQVEEVFYEEDKLIALAKEYGYSKLLDAVFYILNEVDTASIENWEYIAFDAFCSNAFANGALAFSWMLDESVNEFLNPDDEEIEPQIIVGFPENKFDFVNADLLRKLPHWTLSEEM